MGLHIDLKLNWNKHIEEKINKCGNYSDIMMNEVLVESKSKSRVTVVL